MSITKGSNITFRRIRIKTCWLCDLAVYVTHNQHYSHIENKNCLAVLYSELKFNDDYPVYMSQTKEYIKSSFENMCL